MAKFRTNHGKSQQAGSGMIVKVGLFGGILAGLFFIFNQFTGGGTTAAESIEDGSETEVEALNFLPASTTGEIIRNPYYTLSYSENDEQAEWVAYVLTADNLNKPWMDRQDLFLPDSRVRSGSATPDDYRNSGYDRGHLVPAADMAYDEKAMEATFLMSNISPQASDFNQGIWRELEELTRSWAKKNKKLYVVSGPVLTLAGKGKIGEEEVTIPAAYYKILLDLEEPQQKGIAFVLKNEISYEPLHKFATSIDAVEEITAIDFFPDLLSNEQEEELEANFNIDLWEFSKAKYEERIEKWNKQ